MTLAWPSSSSGRGQPNNHWFLLQTVIRIISVEMCSRDFRIFVVRVDLEGKSKFFIFCYWYSSAAVGVPFQMILDFSIWFPLFSFVYSPDSFEDVYSDMRTYPAGLTLWLRRWQEEEEQKGGKEKYSSSVQPFKKKRIFEFLNLTRIFFSFSIYT